MSFDDVEVEFTESRAAKLYRTYSAPSTQKAILDAKRIYAEENGVSIYDVTGHKWVDGWDPEKDASYMTIAVSLESE